MLAGLEAEALAEEELRARRGLCKQELERELTAMRRLYESALQSMQVWFQAKQRFGSKKKLVSCLLLHLHRATAKLCSASNAICEKRERKVLLAGALEWWRIVVAHEKARIAHGSQLVAESQRRITLQTYLEGFVLMLDLKASAEQRSSELVLRRLCRTRGWALKAMLTWYAGRKAAVAVAMSRWKLHAGLRCRRVLGEWGTRARKLVRCSQTMAEMATRRGANACARAFQGWKVLLRVQRGRRVKIETQKAAGAMRMERAKLLTWMCWMGSDARSALSIVALRLRVWQLQRALVFWKQGLNIQRRCDIHIARMFQRRERAGLLSCCSAWKQSTAIAIEIRSCVGGAMARRSSQLQRAAFAEWSALWRDRGDAEAHLWRRARRRLRQRSLMGWCRWCDVRGRKRRRVDRIDASRARSTALASVRTWRSFLGTLSALEAQSEEMSQRARRAAVEKAKRGCVCRWKEETRAQSRSAGWAERKCEHGVRRIKSRSLRAWVCVANHCEELLEAVRAKALLRDVELSRIMYTEWVSLHRYFLALARDGAHRKTELRLRAALQLWRGDTMDMINERHACAAKAFSLKFRCFRSLRSHLSRRRTISAALCGLQSRSRVRSSSRFVARWQECVRRCIVASKRVDSSRRKHQQFVRNKSLRNWRMAVDIQLSALRYCHRAERRQAAACLHAVFAMWASELEVRAAEYSRIATQQNREFVLKTWKQWWELRVEGKEERQARISMDYSMTCSAIRAWKEFGRMCIDVSRKISVQTELWKRVAVRTACIGWQRLVHQRDERAGAIIARIRRRQIARRFLLLRRAARACAYQRCQNSQCIARASALRSAKTLRASLEAWEQAVFIVEVPRLSLRAKEFGVSKSTALRHVQTAFACWRSASNESLDNRRFTAAFARAQLLRVMARWQGVAGGGRDVRGAAALRTGRAAARLVREVWMTWCRAFDLRVQEREVKVLLGTVRMQRFRMFSVLRGWQAECMLRRGASALASRVFSGTVPRAWARWRLHVRMLVAVELEIARWWEETSIRLMPLTYHKGFRDSVFFVWKHLEDHAVLDEHVDPGEATGKSTSMKQGRQLAIRSRSAWYRLSRLLACADLHDRFEAALDAWRRETALAHTKLLRINSHVRRKQSIVLASMLRGVAVARKIRTLQTGTKQRCWAILKKVGLFGRRLRFIESLACGQMIARKAQVYLRHVSFGAWRVHHAATRRAERRVQRERLRARESALHECFAGMRVARKLAVARGSVSQNRCRRLQWRMLRTWAHITWVWLRASDLPLLAHNNRPPSTRRVVPSPVTAPEESDGQRKSVASGTHDLMLRLDKLDPFQTHPSQQLVNFLVGRMRTLAAGLAMREWASAAGDNARVRRFQCRAIIRAKMSDSMRALQLALREWHHISSRQAHIRFLSRTVSDILRAGNRNVASILRGSRARSAERASHSPVPRTSPTISYPILPIFSPSTRGHSPNGDLGRVLSAEEEFTANGTGMAVNWRAVTSKPEADATVANSRTIQPPSTSYSAPRAGSHTDYYSPTRPAVRSHTPSSPPPPAASATHTHAHTHRLYSLTEPRHSLRTDSPSRQAEALDARLYAAARHTITPNKTTSNPPENKSPPSSASQSGSSASTSVSASTSRHTPSFRHTSNTGKPSGTAPSSGAAPWEERERALYNQYLVALSPRLEEGYRHRHAGRWREKEAHNPRSGSASGEEMRLFLIPRDYSKREEELNRAVIAENSFTTRQVNLLCQPGKEEVKEGVCERKREGGKEQNGREGACACV